MTHIVNLALLLIGDYVFTNRENIYLFLKGNYII